MKQTQTPQNFNINDAHAAYCIPTGNAYTYNLADNKTFAKYSPAYLVTNEDLRWIASLTKKCGKKVLTTMASGDQELFYAQNGATIIDTFDITFCARAITEIKTAAISKLTRSQYLELLKDLYYANNIMNVPHMPDIIQHTTPDVAQFVRGMQNRKIFSQGISPFSHKEFLPTADEYAHWQDMVANGPVHRKFIWSDVETLHTHLTTTYDVINLSNIFQYLSAPQIENTLTSLLKYTTPGGYIIAFNGSWHIAMRHDTFAALAEKFKPIAKMGTVTKDPKNANSEEILVLQRTR